MLNQPPEAPPRRGRFKPLTPLQMLFMQELATNNGRVSAAAKKFEVNLHTAREWAKHPLILDELERIKTAIRKDTKATLEGAISEVDQAMAFARSTRNANALVRAVEHKHRLQGFIQDGKDANQGATFNLQIVGVRPDAPAQPIQVKVIQESHQLPAADPEDETVPNPEDVHSELTGEERELL